MTSLVIPCLCWVVGLLVLGIATLAGLGMRRRGRVHFQRAQHFLSAETSTLTTATKGLARFQVRACAPGHEARRSSPALCRGTIVEALLDDAWVECFSSWRGSLLVESASGQRAHISLKRMLFVAGFEDADAAIVQQLPERLLVAARTRRVPLKRKPWMYARRWRTRPCDIHAGESLWILGITRLCAESVAAPGYREAPETTVSRLVSGEIDAAAGARELVVIKAGSLVEAQRLLARRARGYSWGSIVIVAGVLLFVAAAIVGVAELPPAGRGEPYESSSPEPYIPGM